LGNVAKTVRYKRGRVIEWDRLREFEWPRITYSKLQWNFRSLASKQVSLLKTTINPHVGRL
jgi:hypothetical protein